MDKEDFKIDMKEIFEEAQEEFMNQEIKIPRPLTGFECPDCYSKKDLWSVEHPLFKCDKCGCEAKLQWIVIKKGI